MDDGNDTSTSWGVVEYDDKSDIINYRHNTELIEIFPEESNLSIYETDKKLLKALRQYFYHYGDIPISQGELVGYLRSVTKKVEKNGKIIKYVNLKNLVRYIDKLWEIGAIRKFKVHNSYKYSLYLNGEYKNGHKIQSNNWSDHPNSGSNERHFGSYYKPARRKRS